TQDSQGNEIAGGVVPVSRLGGFDFTFDIPPEANLGNSWISLSLAGAGISDSGGRSHVFQIQEFRRPEFEVSARNQTVGPYIWTEPATVAVDAAYFSGGPLPNAEVSWTVTTRDASYSPPNWSEFTFGTWTPWWIDSGFYGGGFYEDAYYEDEYFDPGYDPGTVEQFSGFTDANGSHFLQMDFEGDEIDQPVTVTAEATVIDVNRQAWAASTSLLVHAADLYVGLRSERTFVRRGEPMEIAGIVADIDGTVATGRPFTMEANRLDWRFENGGWAEVTVSTQACAVTSGSDPVSCVFDTDEGGEYRIVATVVDGAGRTNRTELTRWVSGGKGRPTRNVEQEEVTLIPDKAEYAPGGTAEILVEAPFGGGVGLLTIARNGIVSTSRFELDGSSAVLSIPIEEEHIPTLHVQVDVVGATERVADDGSPLPDVAERPAFATGYLALQVPPTSRTLAVSVEPAASSVEPGAATSVAVTVTDASGRPVEGAELAVIVVDEAVLALSNYQLPDPIAAFYGGIASDLSATYGRSSVILENPVLLAGGAGATRARAADDALEAPAEEESAADEDAVFAATEDVTLADGEASSTEPSIAVRTNFDALAVFAPEVTTAADGTALIDVPVPDNLTRYRVMVVAVDGADQFGSAESNITARLPLMVRPSAPRFLNFGDRFELPVVLQNQTDEAMDVSVVVQTSNLVLTNGTGKRVTVPANDRIEVRFPAAADQAGTARFRVAAVSGTASDAATISLPVYTPATAESFATYGVVDGQGTVLQPVLAPTDVWPQFGGLEVNTSSTALQALTDAVIYINDYPYRSADAHASRILAIAALRDVLDAFDAEGLPDASTLNATVQGDIDALAALQNGDGGFPIWRRWNESWPYHSVHAAHALVEARSNGYDVPGQTLDRALEYLRNIEDYYPPWYGEQSRNTISAYALHVRDLAGDTDATKAETLYRSAGADALTLEAVAWLWPVVDDASIDAEIERLFNNQVIETAGAATFAVDYGEDAYLVLHSNRRTDGVILDALIAERPDSDLIPKVVAGLLGNQTRGRWDNMQENTFILLALNNYFDTFEAEDPDFVARIWLGDIYAAEHEYRGRSTDRNETLVPMADVIAQGDTDLAINKEGADGRLYYRLGLRYAPSDLDLDPLDRGFVVTRSFEGVDDPTDVWLDEDGAWHIRAGAEVRVRLAMVADSRRTHVALVDPLPAGLEVLNPALAVSPDITADPNPARTSYWYWQWFGHQNLRDDRAEAFATLLWAGTYEYTYLARATTPGTFVTPPTRAEEMYAPETFGRSGTDIVIVE
ncbi:MAG: alpha-2-macroglobulin, partial [Acidimicrobiales bacterium]